MDDLRRSSHSHYRVINGKFVEKIRYETEMDALTEARFLNSLPTSIHKMIAYKCSHCQYWHIGSNGRMLNDEDRIESKEKLKLYPHRVKKIY